MDFCISKMDGHQNRAQKKQLSTHISTHLIAPDVELHNRGIIFDDGQQRTDALCADFVGADVHFGDGAVGVQESSQLQSCGIIQVAVTQVQLSDGGSKTPRVAWQSCVQFELLQVERRRSSEQGSGRETKRKARYHSYRLDRFEPLFVSCGLGALDNGQFVLVVIPLSSRSRSELSGWDGVEIVGIIVKSKNDGFCTASNGRSDKLDASAAQEAGTYRIQPLGK
jgi:hypothetical protein